MNHNEYKSYLKSNYLKNVQLLKSVESVILFFEERIDIVETTLTDGDEVFLKMTSQNYSKQFNLNPCDLNFKVFEVVNNDKSKQYYDEVDSQKVIIVVEPELNQITSNSNRLRVELRIELGIDESHIKEESPELFAYLMFFDTVDT